MQIYIEQFPQEELDLRLDRHEIAPFGRDNLPIFVDCSDKRPLTDECAIEREELVVGEDTKNDILPARHFGGPSGIITVENAATIMHYEDGAQRVKDRYQRFANGFAGMSAFLSDLVFRKAGIFVNQHSDDAIEGNPTRINPDIQRELGCRYNVFLGMILSSAGSYSAFQTAVRISSYRETSDLNDLRHTRRAFQVLLDIAGGEAAALKRPPLVAELENPRSMTPTVILKDRHQSHERASVVFDLAGYKAKANGEEYFDSVDVPSVILGLLDDEPSEIDERALTSASLCLGVATQQVLGVPDTKVIPENYVKAA